MFGRLVALAAEGVVAAIVLGIGFGLGYHVHCTVRPDVLLPRDVRPVRAHRPLPGEVGFGEASRAIAGLVNVNRARAA
jgi:hypothetical protein